MGTGVQNNAHGDDAEGTAVHSHKFGSNQAAVVVDFGNGGAVAAGVLSQEVNLEGLTGLQGCIGGSVTYLGDDPAAVESSYPEGTTAIVVVGEAAGTHQPAWGDNVLDFPEEQTAMVKALKDAGVNVVTVVVMNRPYVMTPISENSDAVMIVYRPGITAGGEAVAHALFGDCEISGKLPWQIPATMDQVLMQREDVPKDIAEPLYDYGFGIDVAAFGC